MHKLSISRAWDESKVVLSRDGKLLSIVALALIALPSAVATFVNPPPSETMSLGAGLIGLVTSLIAMLGQLALIRMALGPADSVGGFIAHASRRMLPYLGALILLVLAFVLLAIPFAIALTAAGASFEPGAPKQMPPAAWVLTLIFFGILLFLAVRMLMSSPVAVAEEGGSLHIIKRSWRMTGGHFGKLFAFLILFMVAALVALLTTGSLAGLFARLAFGAIEPLSGSALFVGLVQGLVTAAVTAVFAAMLARIYTQLAGPDPASVSVPSSAD